MNRLLEDEERDIRENVLFEIDPRTIETLFAHIRGGFVNASPLRKLGILWIGERANDSTFKREVRLGCADPDPRVRERAEGLARSLSLSG
jgi:hypothetical protein